MGMVEDGAARVVNNRPNVVDAYDISIDTIDTTLTGGTGAVTGFSDIYSCRNLTLDFTTNLDVNNDPF